MITQIMNAVEKEDALIIKKNGFNILMYTCWFSFVVLISPRLQLKYLNYGKLFSIFVILEWALGLGFIVLFFYYIAPSYPFVKSLLGI